MSAAESLTRAHLQQPSGQQQLGTSAEVRSRLIRAALPTGSTGNCPVQGSWNGRPPFAADRTSQIPLQPTGRHHEWCARNRWYPCTTAGGIRRPGAPWKSRCFLLRLHARNPVQKPKLNDAPFLSSFVHSCWSEPKSRAPKGIPLWPLPRSSSSRRSALSFGDFGLAWQFLSPGKVSLPRI